MKEEGKVATFFNGFFAGVLIFLCAAMFLHKTPADIRQKMEKEAINHGAAKWVIDTNSNLPSIKFQWNNP